MAYLKQLIDRLDKGFVVVLFISLIALWPFLSRPSLPQGTDAELHIFRLQELGYLVGGGEFYPRWAPNFYHGYGYPIFNYYAPLTYYLGLPVALLPGFDAVDGVKAVFVLGLLLAAWGMYGFVRDNWGREAGYVAAAVYVYAPYIQYADPHARGVLPESFSFGLFPLALWFLHRLRRQPTPGNWWGAVLLVTAVILTHNLMALLFFALLLAWIGWQAAARERGALLGAAALLVGVGMAAFFWLPVGLEREAVNLNTLLGEGDNYDFRTHFLSVSELLSASQWLDWGATEPVFRFNLGVAQWLLGGMGVVFWLGRRVRQGRHLTFFVLAFLGLIIMMLPFSQPVWEAVPVLPFFQFPWRLLGAAVAMLAILAGAGTEALIRVVSSVKWAGRWGEPANKRAWLTAVLVLLPMVAGLPLSQPAPWPDFGEMNHLRMSLIEHEGRWLGTTSTADYVPVTVEVIPERNGHVVKGFYEGTPIDRINWAVVPAGTVVETAYKRPLWTQYHISAPRSFLFRLFLFDFPGWQVQIDGQVVEPELGRPEGFMVIPVPAGEHRVDVRFGTTPARTLAWAVSGFSLLVAVVGGWWLFKGQRASVKVDWPPLQRPVVGSVVGLTAVVVLILNPLGWLHYDSTGFTADAASEATFADFGDQIALIGYDTSTTVAKPGETIELALYWKAKQALSINYQVFVHVFNQDNVLVAQSDKLNPGEFPTRRWPTDKYVRDVHQLWLPASLAPGTYTVYVGLWVQTEGWRLPLFDEAEQQIGDNFALFRFSVAP